MDKNILSRALSQCYIVICKFSDKGEEYIHSTLNEKIILHVTGKDYLPNKITEKIYNENTHIIFDLKNEQFLECNLDEITQIIYPGFPFEISPHYVVNPNFSGKITPEDIFNYQANDLDLLKKLKTYQKDNNPENNFISNSMLLNIKLINVGNALKKLFLEENNDVLAKDNLCSDICNQYIPTIEFLDKHYLEYVFSQNIDKGSAVINYKYLNQLQKLIALLKENNLELDNLDETNSKNLSKYKELWKKLIQQTCSKLISELTDDTEKFKEEFPELSSEQEEVKFVIDTLTNTASEIDFNMFDNPRSLFSFWPPILYPSPEYVLDTVYLKK